MSFRKGLVGIGLGFSAGYVAVRAYEAFLEWREPSAPIAKDARRYSQERRALEVIGTLRGAVGFAAFAHAPVAARVDAAVSRAPAWLRPALYFSALLAASSLFELPVAFVEDYTLERRYQLSDQRREAWLGEYAKGALISGGLGAVLATLFGFALRRSPRWWPLWAAVGVFPLMVIGNIVVPIYVLPLFNTFEPVTGSLEKRLRALATRFGVGDAAILRMDMSRQTRKANAFVAGVARTHRIVLGDTLIEAFPENETEFVVAHELGHYVNKDTWRIIGLGEAIAVLLFMISNLGTPQEQRHDLRDRPILIMRLYATMLLATQVLRPVLFAFSRSREWAADRFALEATRDAPAGVAAFRRLRDQNLADEDPPAWYEFFFSSHPSLRARIAALENGARPE